MKCTQVIVIAFAVGGCVQRSDYEAKSQEAAACKQQAEAAKKEATQLQEQLASDDRQVRQLKDAVGMAQSQAMTDEQRSQLEEAKRAMQEAQERGKLLDDLQTKFKKMIDAGHLKVVTRHGRVVLQLHDDVLFDTGEAEVKPGGKQALAEVAVALRGVGGKRFQVAGHTDNAPITTETKKKYPTNWELSSARALAVAKLLVQGGVDPGVLSAAAYGPYDPVASNSLPEGQAKNRRIEITLVPNLAELVLAAERDKDKK